MLSLLLTLFISLFSCGSNINQLDPIENNNLLPKQSWNLNNGYVVGTTSDMCHSIDGWYTYAQRVFGNNTFVNGFSYFASGSTQSIAYVDSAYASQFYLGEIDNVLLNDFDNVSTYAISNVRFTCSRAPGDLFNTKTIVFTRVDGNQRTINYRVYDNSYGTNNFIGSAINFDFYYSGSGTTPYDECFIYNTNTQIYEIFGFLDDKYDEGYNAGYNAGVNDGYVDGYDSGNRNGYQTGYNAGYNDASNVDATASTIFTGILDVALIPVNVFLTIFNFEVFGINIAGIVSALLTISVVVIIIRFVTGKKDD